MATTPTTSIPTRKTSERELDLWNQHMRASDIYINFTKSQGLWRADGRPVKWSEQQRKAFERELAKVGVVLPSGMKVDDHGNMNQKNTLLRNLGIGAAITAGVVTGFGFAGMGPLAGLGGTAAAGGGAAGAAGAGGGAAAGGAAAGTAAAGASAAAGGAAAGGLGFGQMAALSAIPTATSFVTNWMAGRQQANAARDAADAAARANSEALAFEREVWGSDRERRDRLDLEEQRRYDSESVEDRHRWGADDARRTRDENMERELWNARAPYRAAGKAALADLARLAGLTVGPEDTLPMVPGGDVPTLRAQSSVPPPSEGAAKDPITGGETGHPLTNFNDPMPEPDDDGLVPVRISADAYRRLAPESEPIIQPRRVSRSFGSLAMPRGV
jgi:hypothetical protein